MSEGGEAYTDPATMHGRDWPCLRQFCVFMENRVGRLHNLMRRLERDELVRIEKEMAPPSASVKTERHLRLADGVDEMTTYVVRVRNLRAPVLTKQIGWGIAAIDHNSMVQNGKLYISAYTGGLRIIDIRRAHNPRAFGFFDTHPETDLARFDGAWGVFAGFPSGNVIV